MSEYKKNKIVVSVKEILKGSNPDLLKEAIIHCLTRRISPEATADIFFIRKSEFVAYFRQHKDTYLPNIKQLEFSQSENESVTSPEVKSKLTVQEKDRIKAVYLNGDSITYTASQVSKEFKKHVSSGDVKNVLIELKVEIRPAGGKKGKPLPRETEFPKRNSI